MTRKPNRQDIAATIQRATARPTNKQLQAEAKAARQLLQDVAMSGVVHEADPPGIDYATVQIDMDTWAKVQAAGSHPNHAVGSCDRCATDPGVRGIADPDWNEPA